MVGPLANVQAVTDAELEELEKQIEQQEAKEKQKTEAARRNAEAAAKEKAEAKRKAEEESTRRAKAEMMKKAEEEADKIAEAERKLKDEQEKLRLEKVRNEIFNSLMAEAKSAESSKDYNLAITKYDNVLNEFPDNAEAKSNIARIQSVLENCKSIIGEWDWFNGARMVYKPDGTFVWNLFFTGGGTWECINPEENEFYMTHTNNSQWDGPIWVVENGKKLKGKEPNAFGGVYMGVLSKLKLEQDEIFKGL